MTSKFKMFGLLFLVGIVLVVEASAAAGELINVDTPEKPKDTPRIVPPALIVPDINQYEKQTIDESAITAPDGRPVAQLTSRPTNLAQELLVSMPESSEKTEPEGETYYEVLASIQYIGKEQVVVVSTSRPSPTAAKQANDFGDKAVELDNGKTAWIIEESPIINTPNRVVWVEDGLIITVAGNLSLEELMKLATDVVVVK